MWNFLRSCFAEIWQAHSGISNWNAERERHQSDAPIWLEKFSTDILRLSKPIRSDSGQNATKIWAVVDVQFSVTREAIYLHRARLSKKGNQFVGGSPAFNVGTMNRCWYTTRICSESELLRVLAASMQNPDTQIRKHMLGRWRASHPGIPFLPIGLPVKVAR